MQSRAKHSQAKAIDDRTGKTMGLDQSRPLEQWQASEVARGVSKLGQQYDSYSAAFFENGVDGAFLASLTEDEVKETLDDLGVESRLHRRVLTKKLCGLRAGRNDATSATCARSVDVSLGTNSGEEMCCSASTLMSPRTPVLMSPRTPRMGDGTDLTLDHCRRRRYRGKSKMEFQQDRSEILNRLAAGAMEDKSEQHALLKRQNSLRRQIQNLKSIAAASQ